jgi:hypothetical protein
LNSKFKDQIVQRFEEAFVHAFLVADQGDFGKEEAGDL